MSEKTVKPITITVGVNTYTLEFNRASVVFSERIGLNLEDMKNAPLSTISMLFFCAFRMHHPDITHTETDRILFDDINGGNEELVKRLCELYAAPTSVLFKYNEETAKAKNVKISL